MVNQLVIVGRDAPAWLAACVFQSALGPAGLRVTVVELPGALGPADVHATLPALEAMHARLRLDEARLLDATRGTYSLGKHFVDAAGQVPSFFHAWGSTGARIDDLDFLPHWIKARAQGLTVAFEDFCLTAAAAKHGRMLLPDPEIERHGFTDYGYHLPSIPYAAYLKRFALQRGVTLHAAKEFAVSMRDDGTGIDALLFADGRRITGDFFIDATGESSLLLGRELAMPRERWRDAFAADRVLVAHGEPIPSLPVYADVRAGETGWTALHPSRVCTHVVHAYSSDIADDAALVQATKLARLELHAPQVRALDPGRRIRAWEANCVAIGEAACVFDPLHGVDLQSVQLGLAHLLPLFPVDTDFAVERDEYNRNVQSAFERLRDFQTAHYALNRYAGAFWSRARLAPLSASLVRRIGVFRARGETVHHEDESFTIADWQSLLIGHGVIPETHDPAVDRTAPELLHAELRRILGFIRQKVDAQRTHADFLRTHN
ncbi:MAG TPA: tryptophan 7-halogenase [Steroidobacteraceae bacterium]|nr:tryptophan 7-halogenase [Steroidobacteraceae bacterium]